MRALHACFIAGTLLLSAGCATQRGVAEFAAYNNALQLTQAASEAILDRVAIAESALYERCVNFRDIDNFEQCKQFDPRVSGFNPADAAYISDAVDPPATAAFRRAMRAVVAYSTALNGLASGETAEIMAARVGDLAALGASAAASVGAGGGAAAALADSVGAVDVAVAAFKPLLTGAFGFATQAAFRDELTAQAPAMRGALVQMKQGSEHLYNAILNSILVSAPPGRLSQDATNRIVATRLLMANWVVMLDATIVAFDVATAAASDESGAGVSGLSHSARALSEAASGARRALAGGTGS